MPEKLTNVTENQNCQVREEKKRGRVLNRNLIVLHLNGINFLENTAKSV
jgi:hypothetical protein